MLFGINLFGKNTLHSTYIYSNIHSSPASYGVPGAEYACHVFPTPYYLHGTNVATVLGSIAGKRKNRMDCIRFCNNLHCGATVYGFRASQNSMAGFRVRVRVLAFGPTACGGKATDSCGGWHVPLANFGSRRSAKL